MVPARPRCRFSVKLSRSKIHNLVEQHIKKRKKLLYQLPVLRKRGHVCIFNRVRHRETMLNHTRESGVPRGHARSTRKILWNLPPRNLLRGTCPHPHSNFDSLYSFENWFNEVLKEKSKFEIQGFTLKNDGKSGSFSSEYSREISARKHVLDWQGLPLRPFLCSTVVHYWFSKNPWLN